MFSAGPNFEEKLDTDYVENAETMGLAVSRSLISASTYGIQEAGDVLNDYLYVYDETSDL